MQDDEVFFSAIDSDGDELLIENTGEGWAFIVRGEDGHRMAVLSAADVGRLRTALADV